MIIYCITCNKPHNNARFCSRSCAASFNNLGKRRHGKPPSFCKICGLPTSDYARQYCSISCCSIGRTNLNSAEIKKARNRAAQSAYRAKQYRVLAPNADKEKIKEIYFNCPVGYEVDHIVPLSKGGLHHEDNLQYLLKEVNRQKNNHYIG